MRIIQLFQCCGQAWSWYNDHDCNSHTWGYCCLILGWILSLDIFLLRSPYFYRYFHDNEILHTLQCSMIIEIYYCSSVRTITIQLNRVTQITCYCRTATFWREYQRHSDWLFCFQVHDRLLFHISHFTWISVGEMSCSMKKINFHFSYQMQIPIPS